MKSLSVVLGGMMMVIGATAQASLIEKSADDFNVRNYEGDTLVGAVVTGNISGWSVDGGNYHVVNSGVVRGRLGPGTAVFSAATGWTIEMRLEIDDSAGAGYYFAMTMGDGTVGHVTTIHIQPNRILGTDSNGYAFDFTGGMHTIRYAREASNGAYHMWLDGTEIAFVLAHHATASSNMAQFGQLTNLQVNGGTTNIDYFRYDTTGAYAPIAVPEPASLVLAWLAGIPTVWRRRKS